MLVVLLPCVSSRVSGFPVASPCLWGKLQKLSFCHDANSENCRKSRTKCSFFCTHVSRLESLVFLWRRRVYGGSWKTCPFVMLPTVKITGNLVRNAGFFCIHVSCLESLVFLWRRCVFGGSWKTCPFQRFPCMLSCRFAWQAWHFVTFQPVW